jgi:hypothetical protein
MLEESCGEAHFYDVALNPRTALMASGCEAVNVRLLSLDSAPSLAPHYSRCALSRLCSLSRSSLFPLCRCL